MNELATSQTNLFNEIRRKPVNVASVPQRSPFRYPGGKTWLVPWVRRWLQLKTRKPRTFIEPFAGGAIAGLTTAFEGFAQRVILVELDEDVASVWQTIVHGDASKLAQRIVKFDLTSESVTSLLSELPKSREDQAFCTIIRNRVSHGGILAPGSGWIRSGENGKGISSRWYPETIANRILNIARIKDRIKFFQADGMEIMEAHAERSDTVFFLDPPYTAAGKRAGLRLYKYSQLDHSRLFDIAAKVKGDFLMTYDVVDEIATLALEKGFDIQQVSMKNTHHTEMTELLIGRDLSWAR